MLTPKLEQLLWEGSAKYETFTLGGSGTTTINQEPGSFIVITDFKFFPFVDRNRQINEEHPNDLPTEAVSHTIRFKSGNEYYYNFRTNLVRVNGKGSTYYFLPSDTPTDTNCYQVHRSTVQIDIWRLLTPNLWNFYSIDPVPVKSNELNPGSGYLGLNQISRIEFTPGNEYIPLTSQRSQYTNPPGYREQFYSPIENLTKLNFEIPPAEQNIDAPYYFPIVNVNLVRINENLENKLF